MKCLKCNAEIPDGAYVCCVCGEPQNDQVGALPPRTGKGRRRSSSKGLFLLLVLILLAAAGAALYFKGGRITGEARRQAHNLTHGNVEKCLANVTAFCQAVRNYMKNNQGRVPSAGDLKASKYAPEVTACPWSKKSYVILGSGTQIDDSYLKVKAPVVLEYPGAHRDSICVGYLNGQCEVIELPKKDMSISEITELVLSRGKYFKYRDAWMKSAENQNQPK